ncbi:MAG TPA: biotin--[acetyl-CoA-carboxylase] ligase [Alphaproteobacteria bacterium]|nr:biotin--[acetyl-CoA-carboxylase] ligase [Alphaproteobacteria bacterium]
MVIANRLHLPTTTSTMDVAAQSIREGAPHLMLITADEQLVARGRLGRMWTTLPGHALAATWITRNTPTQHLALVASLAVIDALKLAAPDVPAVIKWPNDIYIKGKKLAGILVETHGQGSAAIGIGLNVTTPAQLPEGFPGTTVAQHTANPPTPEKLLDILNTCISQRVALYQAQGWLAVAPDYTALCITLGKHVRLQLADGTTVLPATVNALNPDGSLDVVTHADNRHITVTNADKVFHDYLS